MAQTRQPYTFREFPKVVYGPDGAWESIDREEERPDGFYDSPEELESALASDAKSSTVDAKAKAAEAKAAEKALRDGYVEFLERHAVAFDKRISTDRLADLATQLQAHLDAQEAAQE